VTKLVALLCHVYNLTGHTGLVWLGLGLGLMLGLAFVGLSLVLVGSG